jgi:hypothetical protein
MKGAEHDWKNNQPVADMQQKPAFSQINIFYKLV